MASGQVSVDALLTASAQVEAPPGGRVDWIVATIRHAIESGVAKCGERLPASRRLAEELDVARGTVLTALDILVAEGLLEGRRGSGTYVCEAADPSLRPVRTTVPLVSPARPVPAPDIEIPTAARFDFTPCRPSMELFPLRAWRRCLAEAGVPRPSPDYGDARGRPELRTAISRYLRRSRALDVDPAEIIVTNGAVHAMYLLARLYVGEGDVVAMEEPGYPLARQVFETVGGRVQHVSVDADGLDVDAIVTTRRKIRLVYVTPSHQFPTGARLSLARRQRLMEWAAENGALILEDDYDGEFRYDVPPLPPMASLSNGAVIYCGTFSKTLFPSLRIGFAVAPVEVIDNLAALRTIVEYEPNVVTQTALAKLIESGEFERHILRMRRLYARKRKCLSDAIRDAEFPGELSGLDSGINGLIRLEVERTATQICERAKSLEVQASPVVRYAASRDFPDDALVVGYGAAKLDQIQEGIARLASACN